MAAAPDLDALLQVGRQAMAQGKMEQALTILTAATAKAPEDPRTWFSLAALHAKQDRDDLAALVYHKAAVAAGTKQNQDVADIARENAILASSRVLPRDWLPALTHPSTASAWASALNHLAQHLTAQGAALCVGGVGLHAVQLAMACKLKNGCQVVSFHPDQLTSTLTQLLAHANGVTDGLSVQPSLQAWFQGQEQPGPSVHALLFPAACSADLNIQSTAQQVLKVAGAVCEAVPRVCPCRLVVRGVLVQSQELVHMNAVNLDWMKQDTGLDYAPANELLWRHSRALQVDRLEYTCLSQPFTLIEVDLQQLAREQLEDDSEDEAPGGPDGQSPEAAGTVLQPTQDDSDAPAGTDQQLQQQQQKQQQQQAGHQADQGVYRMSVDQVLTAVKHSWTQSATATSAGQLQCVVTWTEVELAPGVWVRYAPHHVMQPHQRLAASATSGNGSETASETTSEVAGKLAGLDVSAGQLGDASDAAVLQPHVWQRVHYLSVPLQVAAGQTVQVNALLHADSLRLQVEETDTPRGTARDGSTPHAGGMDGLPAGESLETETDSEDSEESENEGVEPGGMLLPYHMCMLNDRQRNVKYKQGIQAAVQSMLSSHQGDQPPLVLDVGAGTGLLSLLAAKAGAPHVIGVEREVALVMAATTLSHTNDLAERVITIHTQSSSLVALPAAETAEDRSIARVPCDTRDLVTRGPDGRLQLRGQSALVVHEVFGSDPLSEHVLSTMKHVKAALCSSSTTFMPGVFRVVAALAWSRSLYASRCDPHITRQAAPDSTPDLTLLAPWINSRVEVDVAQVADMLLLTHPKPVITFDLNQPGPPRLQDSALVQLEPCQPTPVRQYSTQGGTCTSLNTTASCAVAAVGPNATSITLQNNDSASTGPISPPSAQDDAGFTQVPIPNCAVYWLEADCGQEPGQWLSTAPGNTRFGHWSQCVDFAALRHVMPPSCAPPAYLSREHVIAAGGYWLQASYVVDRVKLRVVPPPAAQPASTGQCIS